MTHLRGKYVKSTGTTYKTRVSTTQVNKQLVEEERRVNASAIAANSLLQTMCYEAAQEMIDRLYFFGAVSPDTGYYAEYDRQLRRYFVRRWLGEQLNPENGVRRIMKVDNAVHYVGLPKHEFEEEKERLTTETGQNGMSIFPVTELNELRKRFRPEDSEGM